MCITCFIALKKIFFFFSRCYNALVNKYIKIFPSCIIVRTCKSHKKLYFFTLSVYIYTFFIYRCFYCTAVANVQCMLFSMNPTHTVRACVRQSSFGGGGGVYCSTLSLLLFILYLFIAWVGTWGDRVGR